MSRHNKSNELVEQELRNAYLCGCRLLQWMAERLPVDRRSCTMRGMDQMEWYNACSLLVGAGVIDSRLSLLVSLPNALDSLRRHFDEALAEIYTSYSTNSPHESSVGASTRYDVGNGRAEDAGIFSISMSSS